MLGGDRWHHRRQLRPVVTANAGAVGRDDLSVTCPAAAGACRWLRMAFVKGAGAIVKGMSLTFGTMFKKKTTVQ